MGGKSSGNGASFASKASRDFVGTGSMTSRSPSFRMMASSPGNSNSRGIRTALLRPFLKTLTWRSGPVTASEFRVVHFKPVSIGILEIDLSYSVRPHAGSLVT